MTQEEKRQELENKLKEMVERMRMDSGIQYYYLLSYWNDFKINAKMLGKVIKIYLNIAKIYISRIF